MSDLRRMQLGQVVDFVITHNERQLNAEKEEKKRERHGRKRKANQSDINAYFG